MRLLLSALFAGVVAGQWTQDEILRRQTELRAPVSPKKAVVNLDLPPQDRWAWMKTDPAYKDFNVHFRAYITKFVPSLLLPLLTQITANLQGVFDKDYAQEMTGIAAALDLTVGEVVLLALIYQLEHLGVSCDAKNTTGPCTRRLRDGPGLCTGLVAQGPQDGAAVVQGRNLDWNLDPSLLPYVMQVDYQKANTTIFTGVQITGMIGVLHGVRVGAFSAQLNARDDGGEIVPNLLEELLMGGKSPTHQLRRALETRSDFPSAEAFLSSGKLANPAYFVLAGAERGQGVVLTRERVDTLSAWHLFEDSAKDVKKINVQPGWFRLQTNYDHWVPAPAYDDRRTPGVANTLKLCNETVDAATVLSVMTSWPTQNQHTDVTSVMIPQTGHFETYVWLPAPEAVVV